MSHAAIIAAGEFSLLIPGGGVHAAWEPRPLDLELACCLAVSPGRLDPARLARALWPGAAERWARRRLDEIRWQLSVRAGRDLVDRSAGGWQLDRGACFCDLDCARAVAGAPASRKAMLGMLAGAPHLMYEVPAPVPTELSPERAAAADAVRRARIAVRKAVRGAAR